MLRGRHRGLPVAIDRAVLLPHAYARFDRQAAEDNQDTAPAAATQNGVFNGGSSRDR